MLAVVTTDGFALADHSAIKRTPGSIPVKQSLVQACPSAAWISGTTSLYFAAGKALLTYRPSSNLRTQEVHVAESDISSFVTHGHTAIYATDSKIHVLEEGTISRTFDSQKSPITSLSLCLDGSRLASASSSSCVQVHSMTSSSTSVTTLRGIPAASEIIIAFHAHDRKRLIVGAGRQVLVFDVTHPSKPSKIVSLGDETSGAIVGVACSPFSKTLIAAATSSGEVGLIDLDKEKGLFKSLFLDTKITALAFTPEGGGIYFGTEDGKVLYVDLRALDKTPICNVVGDGTSPIVYLCAQKKSDMPASEKKSKLSSSSTASVTSSRASVASAHSQDAVSAAKARIAEKKAAISSKTSSRNPLSTIPQNQAADRANNDTIRQPLSITRTDSISGHLAALRRRPSSSAHSVASSSRVSSGSGDPGPSRPSSAMSRPASVLSRPHSVASTQALEDIEPDLPDPPSEPATPMAKRRSTRAMSDLGLGTPSRPARASSRAGSDPVDAGQDKGKRRANAKEEKKTRFTTQGQQLDADADEVFSPPARSRTSSSTGQEQRERELALQISPRKPAATASSVDCMPSPLRQPSSALPTNAQDFIRGVMQDALLDFRQESHAEMMGLHLDMMRMGRDLRRAIDANVHAELEALREENRRLRAENELLKKGRVMTM
ncbi:WD40 repeat-like protein [Coniophora puteana RWD-64-598 SS2]|uniref:WD40 repeat-like protein n=1 Tax=Coniophora puteana (strain RWD-64-598) TaxID=741705 RepID=A0A5M3N1A7_CONPW|nr:WD40 repeat-like protein [Coniophora puteana RWD-64-598 SS2]EIW84804.1 WD40 repeat-like protein [Coniophora puteana RWD-64-598 SS2]